MDFLDFSDYKICGDEDVKLIRTHNISIRFVGFHERYGAFGKRNFAVYWLPAYKVYRLFSKVL